MVQGRGGAGFALEALKRLAVTGSRFRKKLDGGERPELKVFGLIDHTHATCAALVENAIMRDLLAGHLDSLLAMETERSLLPAGAADKPPSRFRASSPDRRKVAGTPDQGPLSNLLGMAGR